MTIAYASILVFIILTYALTGYAKFSQVGYDNNNPRDFLNKLQGRAQRAYSAHQNCLEAMPIFFAGIIIAHLVQVNQIFIDACAIGYCLLRFLYAYFYIIDKSTLRSITWAIAFILNLYLISGGFFNLF